MFQSRQEQWRDARAFVDAFCETAQVAKDVCLKCRLVLEKLFLNTVTHGHKGGSDAPIWIRLSTEQGEISLTYEDRAPPFNPFPADRAAQYSYLFGRNRIQLTIA